MEVKIRTGMSDRLIEEKIREDEWLEVLLLDNITPRYDFEKNFSVVIPTREYWTSDRPVFERGFLDGWIENGARSWLRNLWHHIQTGDYSQLG